MSSRVLACSLMAVIACADAGAKGTEAADGLDDNALDIDNLRERLADKIRIYVGCLATMNPDIAMARMRYLEWARNGPTLDRAGTGIPAVTDEFACFKAHGGLVIVDTLLPKVDDLDRAGASYKQTLLAAIAVTREAHDYYERKDYKDDRLARGRLLHGQLLAVFAACDVATRQLRQALDRVGDRTAAGDLAAIERGEGKNARWHVARVMRNADLLMRATRGADPRAIAPAGETLARAIAELETWAGAHQPEVGKLASWGSFVRYAIELSTEAKDGGRAVRAHNALPAKGDGSLEKLDDASVRLVKESIDLWR